MLQIVFENRMFRGRLVQVRCFLGALQLLGVINSLVSSLSLQGFCGAL